MAFSFKNLRNINFNFFTSDLLLRIFAQFVKLLLVPHNVEWQKHK